MLTRRLTTVALVLCLPIMACYEEPVRDHLHLAFIPGDAMVVTAVREIDGPAAAGENPAVEERTDEARTDLVAGLDRWGRSFAQLDPVADRTTIERLEGHARRGIHSALVASFRPVERLLADQGLGAFYRDIDGVRELELFPTGASQATRQQREWVYAAMALWAESVADYLEAGGRLYGYLEHAPRRALPCLAHVLDDHPESSGPLNEEETKLVERAKETMERVADVLLIDTNQAYSLNELSRLVFDPFQGRLTLSVDGPVLETEGFVEKESFLERPPVDLWRALKSMTDRRLSPDLVTAMVSPGPLAAQPETDPVVFAALPRRWLPAPDPTEVDAELENLLQPPSIYRVRWRTPPPPEEIETLDQALAILATAESDLPGFSDGSAEHDPAVLD